MLPCSISLQSNPLQQALLELFIPCGLSYNATSLSSLPLYLARPQILTNLGQ